MVVHIHDWSFHHCQFGGERRGRAFVGEPEVENSTIEQQGISGVKLRSHDASHDFTFACEKVQSELESDVNLLPRGSCTDPTQANRASQQ